MPPPSPLLPLPPRIVNRRRAGLILALLVLAAGVLVWLRTTSPGPAERPLGLFTSLPILWSDGGDFGAELRPDAPVHWARAVLARRGQPIALDRLDPAGLAPLRRLVIAQPRVLSPAENVALDDWLRGGGQLLLLADPALTEDSAYPLGDPRRPLAGVMLSPILDHWGLVLQFDERQPLGRTPRTVMGMTIPVNLPGRFAVRDSARCRAWGDGLAVTCAIGRGRLVALADAALLEPQGPQQQGAQALSLLLDAAFVGTSRENAGT